MAAAKNADLLLDVLHRRILLSTLKDLVSESSDQKRRIDALFALLDQQIVHFELALEKVRSSRGSLYQAADFIAQSSASESVSRVLHRLRETAPGEQPKGAAASPPLLAELSFLLAKVKVQLE